MPRPPPKTPAVGETPRPLCTSQSVRRSVPGVTRFAAAASAEEHRSVRAEQFPSAAGRPVTTRVPACRAVAPVPMKSRRAMAARASRTGQPRPIQRSPKRPPNDDMRQVTTFPRQGTTPSSEPATARRWCSRPETSRREARRLPRTPSTSRDRVGPSASNPAGGRSDRDHAAIRPSPRKVSSRWVPACGWPWHTR